MGTYVTKSGAVLTEDDIERMAQAAEAGDYPGVPGEWVVRPQGRPPLCDEELVTITFKVPRSQRDAADARAASLGETRSLFMRAALAAALA